MTHWPRLESGPAIAPTIGREKCVDRRWQPRLLANFGHSDFQAVAGLQRKLA